MWVCARKTMFCKGAATPGLNKVGGIMIKAAPFRHTKAAVKMHTFLDLRGNIPIFIHISDGKLHDVNALEFLLSELCAF